MAKCSGFKALCWQLPISVRTVLEEHHSAMGMVHVQAWEGPQDQGWWGVTRHGGAEATAPGRKRLRRRVGWQRMAMAPTTAVLLPLLLPPRLAHVRPGNEGN